MYLSVFFNFLFLFFRLFCRLMILSWVSLSVWPAMLLPCVPLPSCILVCLLGRLCLQVSMFVSVVFPYYYECPILFLRLFFPLTTPLVDFFFVVWNESFSSPATWTLSAPESCLHFLPVTTWWHWLQQSELVRVCQAWQPAARWRCWRGGAYLWLPQQQVEPSGSGCV